MIVLVSLLASLVGAASDTAGAVFFLELAVDGFGGVVGAAAGGVVEVCEGGAARCSCGGSGFGGVGAGLGVRNCMTAIPTNTSRKAKSSFFSFPGSFFGS